MTGGAGLFGRQIVRALAEAGAKVFAASRDVASLEQEAKQLTAEGLDIAQFPSWISNRKNRSTTPSKKSSPAPAESIFSSTMLSFAPCAAGPQAAGDFAESMAVNATGLFMITRAFGDHMAAHGGGSIINIGSIQGSVGPDFFLYEGLNMDAPPDYFFHKGGLLQLTRYAAAKLGPKGVRVNAISPGGFLAGQDKTFIDRYSARTFLGRLANETDLAGIIVFLASDASAYITGANIPVDGGYTAK